MAGGQYPTSGPGPTSLPPPQPLPGWLGPVVTLTTQVGVPTVIAGVLLYFVLFRLDGTLKDIQKAEDDRIRVLAAMQDTLIGTLNNQNMVFERAIQQQTDRFTQAIDKNIEANRSLAEYARGRRQAQEKE